MNMLRAVLNAYRSKSGSRCIEEGCASASNHTLHDAWLYGRQLIFEATSACFRQPRRLPALYP